MDAHSLKKEPVLKIWQPEYFYIITVESAKICTRVIPINPIKLCDNGFGIAELFASGLLMLWPTIKEAEI